MVATPSSSRSRSRSRSFCRWTRPLVCLFVAVTSDLSHSYCYYPPRGSAHLRRVETSPRTSLTSSSLFSARLPPAGGRGGRPSEGGGEGTGTGGDLSSPPRDDASMTTKRDQNNNNNDDADHTNYWAESREALEKLNNSARGESGGSRVVGSIYNDGGNTFAHLYRKKSTDEFKMPYEMQGDASPLPPLTTSSSPSLPRGAAVGGRTTLPRHEDGAAGRGGSREVPDWLGGNARIGGGEYGDKLSSYGSPVGSGTGESRPVFEIAGGPNRHPFQTSSTDDFKRPHGTPPSSILPTASSTDDFERPSSDIIATQRFPYQRPDRSDNPAWKNSVGRDAYESTRLPDDNRGSSAREHAATTIPDNSSHQRPILVSSRSPEEHPSPAARALAIVLATVSTWHLHSHLGHSPVLASSAVSLLAAVGCVDRRLRRAALCGSLAGMSGGRLLSASSTGSAYAAAMALGGIVWICNEAAISNRGIDDSCAGIGGRSGAIAFLAAGILARCRGIGGVGRRMGRSFRNWGSGASDPSSIVVPMVLYHVLGSMATILLRQSSESGDHGSDVATADPVVASSVVGLLGSLFFEDPTAAMAVYGGSFVGMSLPSRLMDGNNAKDGAIAERPRSTVSLLSSFAGAGAMAGLIHALSVQWGYWNGGWGGKAGLCAFAGCWVYRGFGNMAQFVKQRPSTDDILV